MNRVENESVSGRRAGYRKSRPRLELLEGRQLMAAGATPLLNQGFFGPRSITYTTPSGGTAQISIRGPGTLEGSFLDANGALHLVYNQTSANSLILGSVRGGSRSAPIMSMDDADVASNNFTGVGGNLINTVRLNDFDLVSGGAVNLTGGVGKLYLRSMTANSQVHLRDIPNATPLNNTIELNSLTSTTSVLSGQFDLFGLLPTVATGTGNNNEPFTVPPTFTANRITRTYATVNEGPYASAVALTSVNGNFFQSTNVVGQLRQGQPPPPPGIPGVLFNIGQITGGNPAVNPALVSVQGNLQAIKAGGVTGLVLQDLGNLGAIQIREASSSVIAGYPVGHVNIARRSNDVTIVSSARVVGSRGGVIVQASVVPTGPISLPVN